MNSTSTQFVPLERMGMYEPMHQIGMWGESFTSNGIPNVSASMFIPANPNSSQPIILAETKLDTQSEDTSQETLVPSSKYDQEATKPIDKIQRRLAQNREAARKSRLRKKAYVQQLESSRLKLVQLEQELQRAKQQGVYVSNGVETGQLGFPGQINSGIAAFEMEYSHWVGEQNKNIVELRAALDVHRSDAELRILVENGISQYSELFRMKAIAAKDDVFYVMCGMWRASAERFFLWMGGFRPSELLKVLGPQLEPLTEQQVINADNLRQSCQQAEDALSQGMDKLQHTLAMTVAGDRLGPSSHVQLMDTAMHKLEGLVRFLVQADHLRQTALQQMLTILTIRQAARGMVALGEYFQRLRCLSSVWMNRPREPA